MINVTFSNPRTYAEFNDWPWGRDLKARCVFKVESRKLQQRVTRTIVDPKNGRTCAPKKTTLGARALIADGSDGRTYAMIEMGTAYSIMQSNLKYGDYAHLGSPEFQAINLLFNEMAGNARRAAEVE